MASQGYDFLSDDNAARWKGLFVPYLRMVLAEVHPYLDIEDRALLYLESLLYRLLSKICAIGPLQKQDVKNYVKKNYPNPVNEWAIQEAEDSMDKIMSHKRKSQHGLPLDKIHNQLVKEVINHKVDIIVTCFIIGVLDYVAADALKLAGNFYFNTSDHTQGRERTRGGTILERQLKVSINVDQALSELFELDPDHDHGGAIVEHVITADPQNMKHDDYVKNFTSEEGRYIRHLDMLIKVYRKSLNELSDVFTQDKLEVIFGNIDDLYELSVLLLGMVEDCLEMADDGEEEGKGKCPQIGSCFAELAMNNEFSAFSVYVDNIDDAIKLLSEIRETPEVLNMLSSLQPSIPMFREAVLYVLPRDLLEPIYHCLYYFEIIQSLMHTSTDGGDKDNFSDAYGAMLTVKAHIDRAASEHLPKRREELQRLTVGGARGYHATVRKLRSLQQSIDLWDGPGISVLCTEYIMEGSVGFMREGSKKKTDRHIILLDGLAICCKAHTAKKSSSSLQTPDWRLKEKLNMRKVEIRDLSLETDNSEYHLAFELKEKGQTGYVCFINTDKERNEWMAALTHLQTRSSFDRLLDHLAKSEEQNIPEIKPSIEEYRFAEEDSEGNIVFEPRENTASAALPLIKGGTLLKLVERLTHHKLADPAFVRIFLTTYRSFCSPADLLKLLIERFNVTLSNKYEDPDARRDPHIREGIRRFKRQYQSPIQLRVLNAIRYWVEHHYYDFQENEGLLEELRTFVGSINRSNLKKWVESINRTLMRQREGNDTSVQFDQSFYQNAPPVEWHQTRDPEEFDLFSLHPLEIARQLTLLEADYFRAIHSSELVGCAWVKDQKEVTSPNYLRMAQHSTRVTYWLEKQIVSHENLDERVALVSRICDIYLAFEEMYNFNGMLEVHSALISASVYRLEHTLKSLTPRRQQVLQDGKELIENHYKKYKEKLRSINPPCVPFLGMYLSDILFIEEGGKHVLLGTDGLINFGYRRKVAEVIGEIQQYQNQPYCLQAVPSIQTFFQRLMPLQGFSNNLELEGYIYKLSTSIEPKNQQPKKAPRKVKWDIRSPGHKPSRRRNPSVQPSLQDSDNFSPQMPLSPTSPSQFDYKSQNTGQRRLSGSDSYSGSNKKLTSTLGNEVMSHTRLSSSLETIVDSPTVETPPSPSGQLPPPKLPPKCPVSPPLPPPPPSKERPLPPKPPEDMPALPPKPDGERRTSRPNIPPPLPSKPPSIPHNSHPSGSSISSEEFYPSSPFTPTSPHLPILDPPNAPPLPPKPGGPHPPPLPPKPR